MAGKKKLYNPLSWDLRSWKIFFLVSALWNFTGAIPGVLFPAWNLKLYYALDTGEPITIFLNRGLWWAVLFFGIGYLIIATDPPRQWGIIVMGIIGKTVVAINWFYLCGIGQATFIAFFSALGDSMFTVLFVYYLVAGPREDVTWPGRDRDSGG